MASVTLFAQDYPGQGGRLSGRGQGSNNLRTATDSVKKPPLKVDYFEIKDIGLLTRRLDTIKEREIGVDLLQDDLDHITLGNFYSAVLPLRFNFKADKGNKLGVEAFDIYKKYVPTGIVTSPNRPLAKGYYGTRFEDGHRNINLDFSRTFARNITFGFRIFSGKSEGQFQHQSAAFNALEFNIVQRSKKDRRRSYLHFNIIRNTTDQNLGLTYPDTISTPIPGGNASYDVNNNDAAINLKNTTFKLGTSITLGVDSVQQKWSKIVFVEVGSEKERFRHIELNISDAESLLYSPVSLNDDIDTLQNSIWNLYEKVGFRIKSKDFTLTSGLDIVQSTEAQRGLSNAFQNQLFVNGNASLKVTAGMTISGDFYQELGGLSERKIAVHGLLKIKRHNIGFSVQNGAEAPGLFQTRLAIEGNPVWSNEFITQNYSKLKFEYSYPKTKTKIALQSMSVSDYIYLDRTKNYTASADKLTAYSAALSQEFSWKFFNLKNLLFFQKISDESLVSLPQMSSRHDVSIFLPFFKKKLKTRLGSIIWFRSNYNTPSFHPFLNEFFFEGDTESGNYLRFAPYIKANVSGLEIYIGMDDLENTFRFTNRFEVKGYPQLDSRINLAFKVNLLD